MRCWESWRQVTLQYRSLFYLFSLPEFHIDPNQTWTGRTSRLVNSSLISFVLNSFSFCFVYFPQTSLTSDAPTSQSVNQLLENKTFCLHEIARHRRDLLKTGSWLRSGSQSYLTIHFSKILKYSEQKKTNEVDRLHDSHVYLQHRWRCPRHILGDGTPGSTPPRVIRALHPECIVRKQINDLYES